MKNYFLIVVGVLVSAFVSAKEQQGDLAKKLQFIADAAKLDAPQYDFLTIQTGCARPDLTSLASFSEGSSAIKIYFDNQGTPLRSEIMRSTVSNDQTMLLANSLLKCKYLSREMSAPLPDGAAKTFSYQFNKSQLAHGLARCIGVVEYPLGSRRLGEEGLVRVEYKVLSKDLSFEAKVVSSSGFPRLDNSVLTYVNRCLANEVIRMDVEKDKFLEFKVNLRLGDAMDAKKSSSAGSSSSQSN